MSAGSPKRIHTIAIDYRGFGSSTGSPSEDGLLIDTITMADFAMNTLGIPPSRIVLFGQSLGTAVAISLAHHIATLHDPILSAGLVLVAPFSSVEMLTATYRVAGTIPLLSPVAGIPSLLSLFNNLIIAKWASRDRLATFISHVEKLSVPTHQGYHVTIIHAQDDYDKYPLVAFRDRLLACCISDSHGWGQPFPQPGILREDKGTGQSPARGWGRACGLA
jgi:abhydrolase domain-containing protein 12